MPPDIVINDLTVLRSCVIFLPPVYPLHKQSGGQVDQVLLLCGI